MKISLCIPIYNESSIINDTLKTVSAYMEKNFGGDYEVIFTDDGSTDGCSSAVEAFPNERIRSIGYKKNRGKGSAVRTGMLAAEGDIVIFTDCDLAYGLDVIGQAVKLFDEKPEADIIIGSRNLTKDGYSGYSFLRKFASKAYIKCLALAAGFRLTDSQCGFKCFRLDTARKVFSLCEVNGFAFDFEALMKAKNLGANIVEMPVKIINHRASKVNVLRDSLRMLKDVRFIKKKNRA